MTKKPNKQIPPKKHLINEHLSPYISSEMPASAKNAIIRLGNERKAHPEYEKGLKQEIKRVTNWKNKFYKQ